MGLSKVEQKAGFYAKSVISNLGAADPEVSAPVSAPVSKLAGALVWIRSLGCSSQSATPSPLSFIPELLLSPGSRGGKGGGKGKG